MDCYTKRAIKVLKIALLRTKETKTGLAKEKIEVKIDIK